jgi:hypothetical protein
MPFDGKPFLKKVKSALVYSPDGFFNNDCLEELAAQVLNIC